MRRDAVSAEASGSGSTPMGFATPREELDVRTRDVAGAPADPQLVTG
jgi:hypothetical protein